jgi:hypothetical protein
MEDITERGTAWKTWENIHFLDANVPDSDFSGNYSWIDFQGRWGNTKKLVNCYKVSGRLPAWQQINLHLILTDV